MLLVQSISVHHLIVGQLYSQLQIGRKNTSLFILTNISLLVQHRLRLILDALAQGIVFIKRKEKPSLWHPE